MQESLAESELIKLKQDTNLSANELVYYSKIGIKK